MAAVLPCLSRSGLKRRSSEADLDPSAEVEALGTVQAPYERWAGANTYLQEQWRSALLLVEKPVNQSHQSRFALRQAHF